MWGKPSFCYEVLDSTQEEAKRLYKERKLVDGALIWADAQMHGRGRRGRKWFSPKGAGLWFTVAFKPSLPSDKLQLVNIASGVAICNFLLRKGLKAVLKWPNDVLVRMKKICGILTEGIFNGKDLEFCLLGVGVNLKPSEDFPLELRKEITSFQEEAGYCPSKGDMLSEILQDLYLKNRVLQENPGEVLSEYKKLCGTLGKKVFFEKGGEIFEGIARDVDEMGRLVVETVDSLEVLSSEMLIKVGE